ncbi:trans-anethole oxidase [Ophiostoma piceae UAMH 11346]|uniref:Trans-anethole oxidase n=1 Tax=Ophiostoma piceae (strain UAMH 11346) TaxID=1262450 RepID=S3BU90_OPHP1|nr:trans-anethole oxidase [Ophiostoma piceae UAMH 11346]
MADTIDQSKRHWVSAAIESLDPEKDYELMWRLMSCYRSSDFMNNFTYALTFPNFIVTPHGSEVVWRKDGGKVINVSTTRVEDTENYNMTWWYYGPSDPRCRQAVERINKLHASFHNRYPGNFSHMDDYSYVAAFSAILMHRLRLRIGLSGFSEKEKIAAHHFWRDMLPLFVVEGQGYAHGFPDDFDGCVKYAEDFENMPREHNETARLIGLAIYNQFAFRYFPPGLRWLGVLFCTSLSLPTTLRVMGIPRPNPIVAGFIVFFVRTLMWLSEITLPDPKEAIIRNLETMDAAGKKQRKQEIRTLDRDYAPYVKQKLGLHGCPFSAKME